MENSSIRTRPPCRNVHSTVQDSPEWAGCGNTVHASKALNDSVFEGFAIVVRPIWDVSPVMTSSQSCVSDGGENAAIEGNRGNA